MLSIMAALLLIPLIAMQFTNDVHWKPLDFVVAGILLLGTVIILEFILRKIKSRKMRIGLSVTLLLLLLLIWAELAVGIFGSPLAGN